MAATAPDKTAAIDITGGFTHEVFEKHLAGLPDAPEWWIERKRAAYLRFEGLALPSRTDEGWRFSNISGVTLGGYAPAVAESGAPQAVLSIEAAAGLSFANGRPVGSTALSAELSAKGVIVS